MTRLLPALAVLAGCEIREERFPREFAELNCARHWQCERGSYDVRFSGFQDCIREYEATFIELATFEEEYGCSYDPVAAAAAYDELSGMTCEQWYTGDLLLGFTAIWKECE